MTTTTTIPTRCPWTGDALNDRTDAEIQAAMHGAAWCSSHGDHCPGLDALEAVDDSGWYGELIPSQVCPRHHGPVRVIGYGSTGGSDPWQTEVLACGCVVVDMLPDRAPELVKVNTREDRYER